MWPWRGVGRCDGDAAAAADDADVAVGDTDCAARGRRRRRCRRIVFVALDATTAFDTATQYRCRCCLVVVLATAPALLDSGAAAAGRRGANGSFRGTTAPMVAQHHTAAQHHAAAAVAAKPQQHWCGKFPGRCWQRLRQHGCAPDTHAANVRVAPAACDAAVTWLPATTSGSPLAHTAANAVAGAPGALVRDPAAGLADGGSPQILGTPAGLAPEPVREGALRARPGAVERGLDLRALVAGLTKRQRGRRLLRRRRR